MFQLIVSAPSVLMRKLGGSLRPLVSETAANLLELAESSNVPPIQHVPGSLNPAYLPT